MQNQSHEAQIILALNELRSTKNLSIRATAKRYGIPNATLHARMKGATSLGERRPASHNLTETEEEVVVQYVLDLDLRGFPPLIGDMAAMADHILASRGMRRVGKQWAYRFIQRRLELKTHFSRAYDFQRALCEDPNALNAWFRLVSNMRVKYGILDYDFYNFDETGFMMGQIYPGMIVTRSNRRGRSKSIQPGNRE
jgi:hypothetical protein